MKFSSVYYINYVVACDAGMEVALSCLLCCMGKLDCTEGSTHTVWL